MALIVETGSIVAGADAYCTEQYADDYHESMGNTAWNAVVDKEAAIRKATLYMSQNYWNRWAGIRTYQHQYLDWPRYGIVAFGYPVQQDVIPDAIKRACADLALKASTGELLADQDIAVVREKIGPIETEYDKNASQRKKYPAIDAMLAPYLSGGVSSVPMVRI